jgi:hypothetical protein
MQLLSAVSVAEAFGACRFTIRPKAGRIESKVVLEGVAFYELARRMGKVSFDATERSQ